MLSKSGVRVRLVAGVSLAAMITMPVMAQQSAQAPGNTGIEEIVVTAQRTAQSLQDVPIAVSAFSADNLQKQQINNPLDIQLTLPNITFSKGNFTGSSFTIRGIGDLCVGVTCDSATAIHVEGMPLFGTRLFEAEFFDLERVEVLRGPQGTLFGRNATGGVVNFVNAKPQMDGIHAAGEIEYGNFNSLRLKGMFNLPLTDTLAVRVAGTYLKRDGFTENVFDNTRVDGRDLYAIRGSVRWEPTPDTTIDAMAYYFREDDNRSRIQKQLCQRDPTGVLGCLPGRNEFGTTNFNSTFVGTLTSRELLAIQGGLAFGATLSSVGLGSLYGPDGYSSNVNPANVRQVNTAFAPTYFAEEQQYMLRVAHDFGAVKVQATGMYQSNAVDSRVDYSLAILDRNLFAPGINNLIGLSQVLPQFAPTVAAILPNGANGQLCASDAEFTGTGAFGGFKVCNDVPLAFDRSNEERSTWTGELILSSQLDGPFNFLLGGIYVDQKLPENSYFVNGFGIDYVSGVLGAATAVGNPALGNIYLGTPFFRNNTDEYRLKSYGLFGEIYYNLTDTFKITAGLRYNNDKKSVRARSTLASFPVPVNATNAFDSPFIGAFDADPGTPGNQLFQERNVSFSEFTGRVVADWQVTDNSLIYASYSRGYKSGGINPPLQPILQVPESFTPEFVNAFEIGSKNTFLDGALRANITAFYYQYKGLQLSRIVARTSVNDNVDATVYGLEGEFIVQPTRGLAFNFGASYLKTEVNQDKFLSNPRDPSGGRSDAVIIKDITNGSNCAIVPTGPGGAALSNGYVAAVNSALGLQAPTSFGADSGINGATGAFSICSVLAGGAAAAGLEMLPAGVETNLNGNQLPQAPEFKFSAGAQYTAEFANGMSLVPRVDMAHTGPSYGNIFNGFINRIEGYTVINAQVQLNGRDDRWYLRGFVQNLTNNSATTGLYVTDQSSGLFTNIFTLEPRRYGVAAGFRF